MTVLLRTSRDRTPLSTYAYWVAIAGDGAQPAGKPVPDLGRLLDDAFRGIAGRWFQIARDLARRPGSTLSDTVNCAPNVSDFGEMLAWSDLVARWAATAETVLVVCDDPWMFRHLRALSGVQAGPAPALAGRAIRLAMRGMLARWRFALHSAWRAVTRQRRRTTAAKGATWILSYPHPGNDGMGRDAYFGEVADTYRPWRVLHVSSLSAGGAGKAENAKNSASLHAWGSATWALTHLPFFRWKLSAEDAEGPYGWLLRRAAALEGGTAQASLSAWQAHCQRRWLDDRRPAVVAWPWENHTWERALCRDARARGVRTVGYQHSVVGPVMLNYAARSNADGGASLPDTVACTGESTRRRLVAWGLDGKATIIAGALRRPATGSVSQDDSGPLFVALPFDARVSAEMIEAARIAGQQIGCEVIVKAHPVYTHAVKASDGLRPTETPLGEQSRVSAVVFAATTVGLEAALMGLPTVRFLPRGHVALDILPEGTGIPAAGADGLAEAIRKAQAAPPTLTRGDFFASVDGDFWQTLFTKGSPHTHDL